MSCPGVKIPMGQPPPSVAAMLTVAVGKPTPASSPTLAAASINFRPRVANPKGNLRDVQVALTTIVECTERRAGLCSVDCLLCFGRMPRISYQPSTRSPPSPPVPQFPSRHMVRQSASLSFRPGGAPSPHPTFPVQAIHYTRVHPTSYTAFWHSIRVDRPP
jgi:hypothetical protein